MEMMSGCWPVDCFDGPVPDWTRLVGCNNCSIVKCRHRRQGGREAYCHDKVGDVGLGAVLEEKAAYLPAAALKGHLDGSSAKML
jgi:hypothetical protein